MPKVPSKAAKAHVLQFGSVHKHSVVQSAVDSGHGAQYVGFLPDGKTVVVAWKNYVKAGGIPAKFSGVEHVREYNACGDPENLVKEADVWVGHAPRPGRNCGRSVIPDLWSYISKFNDE